MVVKARVKYFDKLSYFFVFSASRFTRGRTREIKKEWKIATRIKIMD